MEEHIRNLYSQLIGKIAHRLKPRHLDWLAETQIVFNNKLRTTLGRASLDKNQIDLNTKLLLKHPEELEPTFAHELAHLVAPLLYGREGLGHQLGWKNVMIAFGYPPERTHNLDVIRHTHKPVAFATCGCADRTHEIKARTFRKMKYGRREYRCTRCRQHIQIISTTQKPRFF